MSEANEAKRSVVIGLAGFGTALMSLGVWLQLMPPWQAVAVVAAVSARAAAPATMA